MRLYVSTPVIGFRLTRTQYMHILHFLGSIMASRQAFTFASYRGRDICKPNLANPALHINIWIYECLRWYGGLRSKLNRPDSGLNQYVAMIMEKLWPG